MKQANIDFSRLSQRQIAAAHGTSERSIRAWTDAGMPRNADGSYNLTLTIRWRAAHTTTLGEVDLTGIRRGYY